MSNDRKMIDAYERRFLELLVRHELPEHCDVRISVTPKGGSTAEAVFSLSPGGIKVKSEIKSLRLPRIVMDVPCW
jgi:hypothetical protein